MSLFPSEHLSVAITPTAIALSIYKGRWRPVQRDTREIRFDESGIDNALAGLAHALSAWAKKGATVRFSISNAFVRAALLPCSESSLSNAEEMALAQQRFVELYGDMDGWQIQLNRQRKYGQPCLAFAMPTHLVSEITRLAGQHKLMCRGITPGAVHAWNLHGEASLNSKLLFLAVESGYGFFLSTQKQGKLRTPLSVRMVVLKGDASSVKSALRREVLLQGLEDGTHCFCDSFGGISSNELDTVGVPPPPASASIAMNMAMDGWSA